jgi:putative ABC transport system substrate-binding protein
VTIPIVFSAVNEPVRQGRVASLNRPGGDITGMGIFASELAAKIIELLEQLVPGAAVIAHLVNAANEGAEIYAKEAEAAARALGSTSARSMPARSKSWTKLLLP